MTTQNAKKFFGILSLVIILSSFPNIVFSQISEEQYDDKSEEKATYYKFIGIGPVIGTNTIVESYTPSPSSVSYEGLMSYGGTVHFGVYDFLLISGSYMYSKNTKLQDKYKDLAPNIYRQLELSFTFIANPHGRINLYGFVGPSYLMNSYGRPGDSLHVAGLVDERNNMGINSGLGFYFNIPISGAGLIAVSAEWKLNFMLGVQKFDYDSRKKTVVEQLANPVEISTFFSIPRLSLLFYPQF